jgi:hypothetical protein
LLLLREEGTAKDLGILAAVSRCFKRQCDCFVTKRLAAQWFALKEVTNQLQRSNSVYREKRANSDRGSVNLIEEFLTQRRDGAAIILFNFAPLRRRVRHPLRVLDPEK